MKNNKTPLIGLAVCTALVGIAILSKPVLQPPPHVASTTQEVIPLNPLTPEEYDALSKELLALSVSTDPRSALDELERRAKTDPDIANICHDLSHVIGRDAEKRIDFGNALGYHSEICFDGYIHGAIEQAYRDGKKDTILATCDAYPAEKYAAWQCYHGMGHGAMFLSYNNLPLSLNDCRELSSAFANEACATGALMENFNAEPLVHRTDFIKDNDLTFPCEEPFMGELKMSCYFFTPRHFLILNQNDFSGAISWCNTLLPSFITTCHEGVGNRVMKEYVNRPDSAIALCASLQEGSRGSCVKGAVNYLISYDANLVRAEKLCQNVQDEYKEICKSSLRTQAVLF